MKKLFFALLFLLISSCAFAESDPNWVPLPTLHPAVVTKVVDGDTLHVELNGKKEKVRLIGVDTPETKHPRKGKEFYGEEAYLFTKNKLEGKAVFLEFDVSQRDRYGRLLAYVWTAKPKQVPISEYEDIMFNIQLLKKGYARLMAVPPNVKYVYLFREYATQARKEGAGIWID